MTSIFCTRGVYTPQGFLQVPCPFTRAEVVYIGPYKFHRVDDEQPLHSATNFLEKVQAETMCKTLVTFGYQGTIHAVQTDLGPEDRFEVCLDQSFFTREEQ